MSKFNNFSKENHLGPSLEGNKNTLKGAQGVLQNNALTARQNKKKQKPDLRGAAAQTCGSRSSKQTGR